MTSWKPRLAFRERKILRLAIQRATRKDLERIQRNVEESKSLAAKRSDGELKEKVHEFHVLLHKRLRILFTY